jgi:hypothetical protein
MPPERISKKQRVLSWAPTTSSPRQMSRRNKSTIQNYSRCEQIDEPISNPPRTPKTPHPPTKDTHIIRDDASEEEVQMADDQDGDNNGSGSEEEVEIDPADTPTRHNLPSTITIKKRRTTTTKKARKMRKETSWTQCYFNVTTMDETWSKPKEPDRILINRMWTCKLCGPAFTSTDKQRHGNTSALIRHMKDKHDMDARKHALGIPAKKNGVAVQPGAMNQYVVQQDPTPSAQEALLQFFALTNQPFEMIEHKSFQNIFKSVGATCPIQSANVLRNRLEVRFNDTRRELSTELNDTCEAFSNFL